MNIDNHYKYLLYLIKCVITGRVLINKPNDIDFDALVNLAEFHSVENIIYKAVSIMDDVDMNVLERLGERYNYNILMEAKQEYYLDRIEQLCKKNSIRYCVLKGHVIKALYPSAELRQSGDIDLLINEKDSLKMKKILEEDGFKTLEYSPDRVHDNYVIDGNIMLEIHRCLLSKEYKGYNECIRIAQSLVDVDEAGCECVMTHEDYYVFMIIHIAKHMQYCGVGIRMILDVWVYRYNYLDSMDWSLIEQSLKKADLYLFNNKILQLCDYWFEGKTADETILRLSSYILSSGNFGTYRQMISQEMVNNSLGTSNKRISQIILYSKIFFLPYREMRKRYCILEKMPIMLPMLWIYRALKTAFFDKEKSKKIREKYDGYDYDEGNYYIQLKKEIGL